ncbi:hypothetical protein [Bacteroides heparinolyticus]|uniref:hypothetical protein n=1 Tax=Prevotella heparinolytica TaxID=28113 RepID=UPI0035A0BA49
MKKRICIALVLLLLPLISIMAAERKYKDVEVIGGQGNIKTIGLTENADSSIKLLFNKEGELIRYTDYFSETGCEEYVFRGGKLISFTFWDRQEDTIENFTFRYAKLSSNQGRIYKVNKRGDETFFADFQTDSQGRMIKIETIAPYGDEKRNIRITYDSYGNAIDEKGYYILPHLFLVRGSGLLYTDTPELYSVSRNKEHLFTLRTKHSTDVSPATLENCYQQALFVEVFDDVEQTAEWEEKAKQLMEAAAENKQLEVLKTEYGQQMQDAAFLLTKKISSIISPQSGMDYNPYVHVGELQFDSTEKVIKVRTTLRWQAREFLSDVPYGMCKVSGILYLYLPIRANDNVKAIFVYDNRNNHVIRVSTSQHWQRIDAEGLSVTLKE